MNTFYEMKVLNENEVNILFSHLNDESLRDLKENLSVKNLRK